MGLGLSEGLDTRARDRLEQTDVRWLVPKLGVERSRSGVVSKDVQSDA